MPRKARRRRVWGSGTVWQRGGRWWIQWREAGKRRAKSYTDEETARKVLAKIVNDLALGKAGVPVEARDVPTLGELAKPWLAARDRTHRAAGDDRSRWRTQLEPYFGKMKPAEVDSAAIRRFIEGRLAAKMAPNTVGNCVRLLSTFFGHIVELKHVAANPVTTLPRSTRRLYRSDYDTRSTPFLQTLADVRRVYLALPSPINVAFAVGVFAGLRTGEVLAVSWEDIDFASRRLHVKRQVQDGHFTPLKDDEPRVVPLQPALASILAEYKLATGHEGLLFRPTVADRGGRPDLGTQPGFMRPHTLGRHLRIALKELGLPALSWYESTRHSFASLFVLGGGSLELLRVLMGHSSVTTTERYSHLRPDLFAESAFTPFAGVDLSRPAGDVVSLPPASEQDPSRTATTQRDNTSPKLAQDTEKTAFGPVAQVDRAAVS